MPNTKSPLLIYREKMAEIHTPEEIKSAFLSCYAVCFDLERIDRYIIKKHALFADIWQVNPDVIITEADLCIMGSEPIVLQDQFLLINKNGTHEQANEIARLMAECGIVSNEYRFITEPKTGIKISYGSIGLENKPNRRFKGNLLFDGDKILLTVRCVTKAESDLLKQHSQDRKEKQI